MIEIKKVQVGQIEDLQKISIETFKYSFALIYNTHQIDSYLDDAFSLIKLKEEIEEPHSEFYFYYLDEYLIGYLKINFSYN